MVLSEWNGTNEGDLGVEYAFFILFFGEREGEKKTTKSYNAHLSSYFSEFVCASQGM